MVLLDGQHELSSSDLDPFDMALCAFLVFQEPWSVSARRKGARATRGEAGEAEDGK